MEKNNNNPNPVSIFELFGIILFTICHVILSGLGLLVFLGGCMFDGCNPPEILFYTIIFLAIFAPLIAIFSYKNKEKIIWRFVLYGSLIIPTLLISFALSSVDL